MWLVTNVIANRYICRVFLLTENYRKYILTKNCLVLVWNFLLPFSLSSFIICSWHICWRLQSLELCIPEGIQLPSFVLSVSGLFFHSTFFINADGICGVLLNFLKSAETLLSSLSWISCLKAHLRPCSFRVRTVPGQCPGVYSRIFIYFTGNRPGYTWDKYINQFEIRRYTSIYNKMPFQLI
jgi:hypothetical protein